MKLYNIYICLLDFQDSGKASSLAVLNMKFPKFILGGWHFSHPGFGSGSQTNMPNTPSANQTKKMSTGTCGMC
jgi:hypothetical protein